MSDSAPVDRPDDQGVVGPVGIPGMDAARRRWDALPMLGRVFVGLAIVDLLVHQLGLLGLPAYLRIEAPVTLVGLSSRLAIILLPAVLLDRRDDAGRATPMLLQGAVVLALTQVVSDPVLVWLPAIGGLAAWAALNVVVSIATAGGYVLIAFGLQALDRSAPGRSLEGLANLAAGAIAGAALVGLLVAVMGPAQDLGDPGWNAQSFVAGLGPVVSAVALAYLARTVIRGTPDVRRPPTATLLGAGALSLTGLAALVNLLVGLVVVVQLGLGRLPEVAAAPLELAVIGSAVGMVLLVVAFAIGLGDTSVRIPAAAAAGPAGPPDEPEPLRWPTPGGDVPEFHPVPAPAEVAGAPPPAPKRRRRRSKAKPKEQPG